MAAKSFQAVEAGKAWLKTRTLVLTTTAVLADYSTRSEADKATGGRASAIDCTDGRAASAGLDARAPLVVSQTEEIAAPSPTEAAESCSTNFCDGKQCHFAAPARG